MKIENTQILESNLQKVWDSLHDEQVLKECIPGCESLIKTSENSYSVTIRIKISALSFKLPATPILSPLLFLKFAIISP